MRLKPAAGLEVPGALRAWPAWRDSRSVLLYPLIFHELGDGWSACSQLGPRVHGALQKGSTSLRTQSCILAYNSSPECRGPGRCHVRGDTRRSAASRRAIMSFTHPREWRSACSSSQSGSIDIATKWALRSAAMSAGVACVNESDPWTGWPAVTSTSDVASCGLATARAQEPYVKCCIPCCLARGVWGSLQRMRWQCVGLGPRARRSRLLARAPAMPCFEDKSYRFDKDGCTIVVSTLHRRAS